MDCFCNLCLLTLFITGLDRKRQGLRCWLNRSSRSGMVALVIRDFTKLRRRRQLERLKDNRNFTWRSKDATATRTSFKKWICVLSVFTAIIPTHLAKTAKSWTVWDARAKLLFCSCNLQFSFFFFSTFLLWSRRWILKSLMFSEQTRAQDVHCAFW